MSYSKINNIAGWLTFLIAAIVYTLTIEHTASWWDCGEFISAAYKLQVVHQPGAPLFLMVGRMFSLLASDPTKVAYWINMSSALASAATILFLFWTITALVKRVISRPGEELTTSNLITIIGSALVGALAYTFSDSFWFSAAEAEVYAMSSMATAVVFWAILKWDAHADEPYADRWLIFIAYVMGLSIGVHLLNLLAIPAMALVYYFRRTPAATSKGTLKALLAGIFILGFIQYGIIQYLVRFAAMSDLLFVNTLGMGFGTGVTVFCILLIVCIVAGIRFTLTGDKTSSLISAAAFILMFTFGGGILGLLVGAGIIAILEYGLKIRNKRATLNLVLLSTVFVILGYSSFAMIVIRAKADTTLNNNDPDNVFAFLSYLNREQYGDRPLAYGQYFDAKAIDIKQGDDTYRKGKDKYEVTGKKQERVYERNTIFPRMYSDDGGHPAFYREWMRLGETESPTFIDNLGFFFSYQTGQMYARYFLWNFAGRQNDEQGHGNYTNGNWISGIKVLDALRLGNQDELPQSIVENGAYNRFYFLPLILGLIGAFWHFKRRQKDAGIVGLLFFFTGMAIVIYLNQTPLQPRERDYAFTGSFYAFAIWIGLGVAAIADYLNRKLKPSTAAGIATGIGLLIAPFLMAKEGWNDHDRSDRFMTRDMATDYLESCAPNAILFTYGDNDTYPLWYVQEVEKVRPDIRIVNLSLLGTDWYIRQMKQKVNQSDPLPLTMGNEKFVQGVRDVLYYQDYQIKGSVELKNLFELLTSDNDADKATYQDGSRENFLPTKKLKLTIDPQQIMATKTVSEKQKGNITPVMEWTYNQNYVTKAELALFDILANNNWKRPIYFAITVPSDNYIGLDSYLYNEGLAYRLLPLQPPVQQDSTQRPELANTDAMYDHMVNKFKWGNMKNARYLDPESTRMVAVLLNNYNVLAESLFREGRTEEARKALNKCLEQMPDKNFSVNFTIRKYYMASLFYRLKEVDKANKMVSHTVDYLADELNYLITLSKSKGINSEDIRMGMSILNEFLRVTEENKQPKLNQKVKGVLQGLESKFSE
ncbi:MAG TPA: DUF2723 domain-containing protein [Sphingobacteriaceae bacterium]|nr:DUF2723 domain-containing protein [Sphingobacteriaceae bacterium]